MYQIAGKNLTQIYGVGSFTQTSGDAAVWVNLPPKVYEQQMTEENLS